MIINVLVSDKENIIKDVNDCYVDENNNLHIEKDKETLVISNGRWQSCLVSEE